MKSFLCIGPLSSGKTSLLQRLQEGQIFQPIDVLPSSISTVGTNLCKITVLSDQSTKTLSCRDKGKKLEVEFRELGGAMAPIWASYFSDDFVALMYVIDASNARQISGSCILLLDILSNKLLQSKPVLLVFNKIDLCDDQDGCIQEVKEIMRFDDICLHALQDFSCLEVSVKTGQGLNNVLDWIKDKAFNVKPEKKS